MLAGAACICGVYARDIMTESVAYRAFVAGFLGPRDWARSKEGCPLDLLDALGAAEKERAAEELLTRVSIGDSWPIQGLGRLGHAAALPRLRALLKEARAPGLKEPYGGMVAYVALAIWQIDRDSSMCEVLIRASMDWYTDDVESLRTFQMIDIIHCLAQFPQQRARDRLKQLESSPNHLIAYNAGYAQRLHPR